jgi:hypothetical protein
VFLGDFGHSDVSEEFIEWLGDEKFWIEGIEARVLEVIRSGSRDLAKRSGMIFGEKRENAPIFLPNLWIKVK